MPDGTLRYPITNRHDAWKRLRSYTPADKPCLGFVDTCNQNLKEYRLVKTDAGNLVERPMPAARGYPPGTTYVPSRAPTPGEVRKMSEWFPEGFVYFAIQPDDRKNSVIEPGLEPVLREIAEELNPPRPGPVVDPERARLMEENASLQRALVASREVAENRREEVVVLRNRIDRIRGITNE
jgi:hypothetical protein